MAEAPNVESAIAMAETSALLMGEIYSSLAVHATLAAEIRELENQLADRESAPTHLEVAAEAVSAANDDVRAMEQAALDAMQAAVHERELRMRQSSKLRVLKAEKNADGALLAELEAERKRGQIKERELRDARARAQQATERHAAGAHSLRQERQQAQRLRLSAGARQILTVWRHDDARILQRGFFTWRAMVAAGLHAACLPEQRPCASSYAARDEAANLRMHDAAAYHMLRVALDGRTAECVRLRQRVVELSAELQLQDYRDDALRRSSQRAAQFSAALLEARHEQARLTEVLTAANLELRMRNPPREEAFGASCN